MKELDFYPLLNG